MTNFRSKLIIDKTINERKGMTAIYLLIFLLLFLIVELVLVIRFALLGNFYSSILALTQSILVSLGALSLYFWSFWPIGIAFFLFGIFMFQGYKELSPGDPREAGLIAVLGKRTHTRVEGTILLLNWIKFIPDIIGVIEFNMQTEDKNFPIGSVRCADGIRVKGEISIAAKADPDNLDEFDDIKRMPGFHSQVDEILVTHSATIAKNVNVTYKYMETYSEELALIFLHKLKNMRTPRAVMDPSAILPSPDNPVSIQGMGILVTKIQVKFIPIDPDIIKADERVVREELERKGQVLDTETINMRAEKRLDMYRRLAAPGQILPTIKECRDEIIYEDLVEDKKVEIVGGGRNLNLTNRGNNPNPSKGNP